MNARTKWKEFNKWWAIKREQSLYPTTWEGKLAQSIDDKLKELQEGKK